MFSFHVTWRRFQLRISAYHAILNLLGSCYLLIYVQPLPSCSSSSSCSAQAGEKSTSGEVKSPRKTFFWDRNWFENKKRPQTELHRWSLGSYTKDWEQFPWWSRSEWEWKFLVNWLNDSPPPSVAARDVQILIRRSPPHLRWLMFAGDLNGNSDFRLTHEPESN